MKKVLTLLLIASLLLSLTACSTGQLQNTETEIVEAIVTDAWSTVLGTGVTVEYGGAKNDIVSTNLYLAYRDNLGSSVTCYLIIKTYDNKTIKQLVYNAKLNTDKDIP